MFLPRVRFLLAAAAVLVPTACCVDRWGAPHDNDPVLSAERPECPRNWNSVPLVVQKEARMSGATAPIGPGGLPVPGPITNIPEFHDCQRFIIDSTPGPGGERYDSLYAIFAAFKLDTIVARIGYGTVAWSSSNNAVATVAPTGVVTGISPGAATINATSTVEALMVSSAAVTVLPGAGSGSVGRDTISPSAPATPVLTVGQSIELVVEAGPVTVSTPLPVAQVYSYGGTYGALGIMPNFSCLYLFVGPNGRLRARMVPSPNQGTSWNECFSGGDPLTSPNGKELSIIRRTGGAFDDYPPVARWDWDPKNGKQYIGIKCGAAWCEIGADGFAPPEPFQPAAGSETGAARVTRIKGWYDEQALAIKVGSGPAIPSHIRATIIPHPQLKEWSAARYKEGWTAAGYIALRSETGDAMALTPYKQKLNLDAVPVQADLVRMNQLFLCYGTKAHCKIPEEALNTKACKSGFIQSSCAAWWSKVIAANGDVAYRCVTRRDHSNAPPGVEVPGTTRWRWVLEDETTWLGCTLGCCEVDALM